MKKNILPLYVLGGLLLAACARTVGAQPPALIPTANTQGPVDTSPLAPAATVDPGSGDLTRVDEQGQVVVEVRPTNLRDTAETLEFDVSLNTHTVDLSMDLAALSSLTTDTGKRALAASWDGTPGGHHVGGKLIFYVMEDGKSILEGATSLRLTIVDVYAPSRTFEWQLQ